MPDSGTDFALPLVSVRKKLTELTLEGLAAITASPVGVEGCKRAVAYHDTSKDDLVTALESFQPAVDALSQLPAVQALFGAGEAERLAIQFVFNACRRLADGALPEAATEATWGSFVQEVTSTTWCCRAVANMQNIDCSEDVLVLGDGISVRGRSLEDLSVLLKWGPSELGHLANDWMEGAMSSFVLLVENEIPKNPDNLLVTDDGSAYVRAARMLLAMRLLGQGDVRIGRLFRARPAAFNVGIGGMHWSGSSVWHPGPVYRLTPEQVPGIVRLYEDLGALEMRRDKATRPLLLALRSFSSIYDRLRHQADDRIVDAITALEALWGLDRELAFRLAFRTAALLAKSDDERVSIYETLSEYYAIRSKLVHGGSLSAEHEMKVREDEPLRAIVRRAVRAFVHAAVSSQEWTLTRLRNEVDAALLHSTHRSVLQQAMDI